MYRWKVFRVLYEVAACVKLSFSLAIAASVLGIYVQKEDHVQVGISSVYTTMGGSPTLNFKQLIQIFPSISALSLQSTIFHVVAVHQAHLTKHNLSCSLWSTYLDSERCISKGARFQIRSSLLSRGRTFFKNLSGLWTRWLVRVHWFTLNYLNRRMHRLSDINHPLWELRCPLFIHVGSDYEIFIQSTKGYWTTGLMRAQGGEISCAN